MQNHFFIIGGIVIGWWGIVIGWWEIVIGWWEIVIRWWGIVIRWWGIVIVVGIYIDGVTCIRTTVKFYTKVVIFFL